MIDPLPALIRLYLRSIGWGLALGLLFTALLLAADVAGLRHLLLGSRAGLIGVGMLAFFHSVLFAGVQFGIVVMGMAEDQGKAPGAGLRARLWHRATSAGPMRAMAPSAPIGQTGASAPQRHSAAGSSALIGPIA